jgi:hypothetical protein
MNRHGIYISLVVVLLLTLFAAYVSYFMSAYNYTFIEVINKTAVELKLVEQQERLINYEQKFENLYLSSVWENAEKSKFLPILRGKSKNEVRTYYLERLLRLSQERIFVLKCESLSNKDILLAYYCAIQEKIDYHTFLNYLMLFSFVQPKEVGEYGNALEFAIVYDLLNSSFHVASEEDNLLQAKMRDMLGNYLSKLDGDSASLFHGRSVLASNAFILASQLKSTSQKSDQLISRAIGHYLDFYQALKNVVIWPEGYNYWINERALPILIALEAFKNLTIKGESYFDDVASLQLKIAHWHIYNTRPDWKIQGWGDEGPRVDLKDETGKVVDYLALVTDAPEVKLYASLLAKRFATRAYWFSYKKYLPMFANDTWLSKEFSNNVDESITLEPLSHLLPKTAIFGPNYSNHVVIRSGWGPDDTFLQFRASQTYTHHQHYDAGHFTLFKKEPLIVNSSTYSGMDSENRKYFSSRSISKNTIKVMNPDESFSPDRNYELVTPDGGQRIPIGRGSAVLSLNEWQAQYQSGEYHNADLLKYDLDILNNVLIRADITRSFNSIKYSASGQKAKVRRVVRNFVYMNSIDSVILYDEVVTTSPKFPVLSSFFIPNRPSFIEYNDAKLTISSLINSGFDPILIGGPTYRNFVSDTPDLTSPTGVIFPEGGEKKPWYDKSDWRIEIPYLSNQYNQQSLTILRPNSITAPKLLETNAFVSVWKLDNVALVWLNQTSEKAVTIESLDGFDQVVFASSTSGTIIINQGKFAGEQFNYEDGLSVVPLNSTIKQ